MRRHVCLFIMEKKNKDNQPTNQQKSSYKRNLHLSACLVACTMYVRVTRQVHVHTRVARVGKCQVSIGSSGCIGGLLLFADDAFDSAQLNPDESSQLIHLIRENYG